MPVGNGLDTATSDEESSELGAGFEKMSGRGAVLTTITPLRHSIAPYESYSLDELLRRTASRVPTKTAIIDGERRFTYKELDSYADRFAAALAGLGVSKGDRVGILAPNCVEFEIAFFGIIRTGATATTVNSGYREREIAHQLNDSGANVLIVHETLVALVESARSEIPALERVIAIEESSNNSDSFWGLMENAPTRPPSVAVDPDADIAVLPYSSGTTGLSKGVMLSHFNLSSNVRQFLELTGEAAMMRDDEVVLVHLPLFHIYGMNVLMNACIGIGATQVLMGRFDMELLLGLLSQHSVTRLYTVPPVGLGLTQYPGVKDHDLSALRLGFLGAAPLSGEMQGRIQEVVGSPIIQGYGLTETSPVTNSDFMEPGLTRPGSVGPAVADTEERVVDLETGLRDVPAGEVGELIVRGPQVMKGYYSNPEATSETLAPDGWLRTGDIVRMDDDGYVWILDRKKELIKYKGFQVPPAELEGLLLEHPAIADAAVIGKADVEAGEVPKAFVVRKAGFEVSGQDVINFVAGKVATFKHVREVEFVDSIPKNPSGKILRRVLIEEERAKSRA